MYHFIFLFTLFIGCKASSPPQNTVEQLIPVNELKPLGFEVDDSISFEKYGIDIQFKRVSEDYYQVKQKAPVPISQARKQKIIYNIDYSVNSGNKDKSKFEVTDKSKDKSQENSGNKDKSNVNSGNKDKGKDKSKVNSGNKTKEKGGLPWWLWLLIILIALIALFYKKIKAWVPLPWRALLPCMALLIYTSCAMTYNPEHYPIGEKFVFFYADSTLGEGYVFQRRPFHIELADDTTNICDAKLGIIRPKFLIRPTNVYKLNDALKAREGHQ